MDEYSGSWVRRQGFLLLCAGEEFLDLIRIFSPIVEILATYIGGQGPLPPKCLGGKGIPQRPFEREHKDARILTKGGLRLQRGQAVTRWWARR